MGRGGLFAGAAARIALLVAALAAAMFLLVRDGVAAESDRALLPPVVAACEEGECPSVVLCEPGSVWDARARTCRQVSFCPGDRKVQIPGGPCELYCRPGMEANPFDPNRCRPVVSCPQGTTEKADGVCEIACPDGRQENPYAPGTCRPAFFCPDGHEEVAEGKCAPQCGAGEERDPQDGCRPIPLTAAFCAWSDMAYDAVEKKCLSFPHYCPLIGKIHEPFANRCVANPEICQQHGMVYDKSDDKCFSPVDGTCRQANMFFHVSQCVSVDPASCPAMGRVYDSENDQCIADAEICRESGLIYDSENDQCIADAESCRAAGLIYISTKGKCFKATGEICHEAGMLFDNNSNSCFANEESCRADGRFYDSATRRCVASADSCGAIGQFYDLVFEGCVATCKEGTEPVGNECLHVCRNNDHNGRFLYDPYARLVVSSPAAPVTRAGLCVCPLGADGDDCRELNRSHGTTAVKLHFAHSLTLANGEFLLGQGVSVGVMEGGPLQWQDLNRDIRSHSELSNVKKTFCSGQEERGNIGEGPCYDERGVGVVLLASHGIAVLGVMAAKKDGRGLVGIAPESDYLYAWYNYNPLLVYKDLVTHGASIINNSWTPEYYIATHDFRPRGNCGSAGTCLEEAMANLRHYARREGIGLGGHELPTDDGRKINLEVDELFTTYDYAASKVDGVSNPADRPIYVRSAGNNNGRKVTANITILAANGNILTVLRRNSVITATSLASIAGLPYYFPDMTLNNLAVAAVDEFSQSPAETVVGDETLYQSPIAGFSNPCGEGASSFCLAAPGVADYEYGNAEYAEIALLYYNRDCNLGEDSNGRYRCGNEHRHKEVLTYLLAEHFRTVFGTGVGLDSGFLLAPETERYRQRERRLTAGYDVGAGTSFAAPIVSGALALMKSYFMLGTDCGAGGQCGLGSHELTERILATADRRGIYADASIYGSGLLDLKNALTPQGELRLLLGRSVQDSSSHLLSQSALNPGSAFGDSAARALGGVRLAAFDDMNAPFPVFGDVVLSADDSAEGAGRAGGEVRVGEALRAHQLGFRGRRHSPASDWDFEDGYGFLTLQGGDFLSSWGVGVGGSGSGSADKSLTELGGGGFGNPYSALVGDGMVAGVVGDGFRMAAFGEGLGVSRRIRGAFAEFSLAPFAFMSEGAGLSFQVGGMEELDGLLDTSGAGLFGGLRARTAFAGLGFSGELPGDWRVRLGGFAGRTAAEDEGGWFSSVEDLWSGSYALGLERDNVLFSGDALGFRVHQPLRTSGGLQLRVPTGRTRYGELTWREVSGAPSGRELIWEGLYRRSAEEGDWLLSAGLISQPGHRSDAKTQGRALLAFERAF